LPPSYHVLNYIAIDLQLYKILKITQVSFFGKHCNLLSFKLVPRPTVQL